MPNRQLMNVTRNSGGHRTEVGKAALKLVGVRRKPDTPARNEGVKVCKGVNTKAQDKTYKLERWAARNTAALWLTVCTARTHLPTYHTSSLSSSVGRALL